MQLQEIAIRTSDTGVVGAARIPLMLVQGNTAAQALVTLKAEEGGAVLCRLTSAALHV